MSRSRRDQSFTQRDLTRAIKAVKAAGINAHIEVDTVHKKITVIPGDPPKNNDPGETPEDLRKLI